MVVDDENEGVGVVVAVFAVWDDLRVALPSAAAVVSCSHSR